MSKKDIFTKHLPNIKLATRFDADGNEIDVEIREDAEQIKRKQDIFDILVAIGYFRAHIRGLSAFNKIVGGMVWCMEACDYDVDVDLFFDENLTIGQKIALTEKIIAILPKMQCPYQLEPHQIQGLDFINIFPVIQWLGKRSVENRKEKAKKLKEFAVSQFQNTFQLASDESLRDVTNKIRDNAAKVGGIYGIKRQFKRKQNLKSEDEIARVQSTLLEYGDQGSRKQISMRRFRMPEELQKPISEELDFDFDELDIESLLKNLSITNEKDIEFLALTDHERERIQTYFDEVRSEMLLDSKELFLQNQLKALAEIETNLKEELSQQTSKIIQTEEEISEIKLKIEEKTEEQIEIKAELEELQAREDNADKSVLETVQSLIITNENLKKQETEFKDQCRKELERLQATIAESESKTPEEELEDVRNELSREQERLQNLRLQLAKQNRMIVTVQRQLDNIPDRTELAQYQKRFLELYNQVNAKHRETKQFFTLYNTLNDTKMCLQKELSFLSSIYESYNQAMTTNHSKENFIKQLESLIDGIKQMTNKRRIKVNDEKAKRDQLNEKLLHFVEESRALAAIIKQLKIEFSKSENYVAANE